MKTLKKNLALIVAGVLFATLMLANSAGVFASAVPVQPDPTECTDCQDLQDQLDAAYIQIGEVIGGAVEFSSDMEGLLERATTNIYEGDVSQMEDNLDGEVISGHLLRGTMCQDDTMPFSYYSSFQYEGQTYCFENEDMWYGTEPNYFNFFNHMMYLTEFWDAAAIPEWQLLWDEWIELLYDHDAGGEPGIIELTDIIIQLIADLEGCEDDFCAEEIVECPDCESIASTLESSLDDLDVLEDDAEAFADELDGINAEIEALQDQLAEWDTLRAEFEAMVEDAGGMHGEDCDNFDVQSGQSWGIAHNFGNVQWCFTNEGQLEEMIQNLDEYWQTHSSSHLPSEAVLNEQLDNLFNELFDKLAEYQEKLDAIANLNDAIDLIADDLADCLTELQALQDVGECLDQDIDSMQAVLDRADGIEGFAGGAAGEDPADDPADDPAADDDDDSGNDDLEDILDHWAEEFIRDLFGMGIVSGDGDTGNFRPNDELNRAEAAKILVLGTEESVPDSFFDIFYDVTEDSWFWSYVNAASDAEYFNGYEDGSFKPGNSILRAEAIAVVLRALGFDIPEYEEYSFPDLTGDEWFADVAEKAFQCGLVGGRDGMLEGGDTITRAEFSKIVDLALFGDLDEWECADYVGCPVCEEGDTECEQYIADQQAVDACLEE